MRFTFCSFTYNQKDFIVQQLESIKYQIERFGSGTDCYYLLADDHSNDGTPEVVSEWLKKNPGLFRDTKLIVSDENKGIVGNYTNALKNIETEYFKITGGDDFYYKNNVFNIYADANLVLSPLIFLGPNNSVIGRKERFIRKIARFGDDSEGIKGFIIRQYRYGGGINAPGVFLSKEIIDDGLYEVLKNYKWIEDAPEWYYLMGQKTTKVRLETDPLVVYRTGSGITQKPVSKGYLEDLELIRKTIHVRSKQSPRLLNPFFYEQIIDREISSIGCLTKKDGREKVRELNNSIKKEMNDADGYISMIIKRAEAFECQ